MSSISEQLGVGKTMGARKQNAIIKGRISVCLFIPLFIYASRKHLLNSFQELGSK